MKKQIKKLLFIIMLPFVFASSDAFAMNILDTMAKGLDAVIGKKYDSKVIMGSTIFGGLVGGATALICRSFEQFYTNNALPGLPRPRLVFARGLPISSLTLLGASIGLFLCATRNISEATLSTDYTLHEDTTIANAQGGPTLQVKETSPLHQVAATINNNNATEDFPLQGHGFPLYRPLVTIQNTTLPGQQNTSAQIKHHDYSFFGSETTTQTVTFPILSGNGEPFSLVQPDKTKKKIILGAFELAAALGCFYAHLKF